MHHKNYGLRQIRCVLRALQLDFAVEFGEVGYHRAFCIVAHYRK